MSPVRAGIVKRFDDWLWSGRETLSPRDEVDTMPAPTWHIPVRCAG